MTEVQIESTPREEWRREGQGFLRMVGDVRVLRLKGSFYEMGRQHGALLKEEIPQGPIPYFRTVVERLMGRSLLGPLSPMAWTLLQRTIGRRVAKAVPPFALETIRGLADGAGLDYQTFLDGCTMPDSLMWATARAMTWRGHGPAVAHRLQLGLGCTSAVAWGDATRDGALLHARNFDYYGVGAWPDHKAVIFHEPEHGQRYVSVASAGVGLGGVTAMNDAGLSLTVHQHMFTNLTALGGTPIGIVGDIVMREAESLDDAQRILEAHRPIGCWTYMITDGKTKEVLCAEESPERRAFRRHGRDRSTFAYANVYLDPELGKSEVDLYGSYWRHNSGRHRIATERLHERQGALDPQGMADILADVGDPRCRVRSSIAMVMTVGSVVFRPEDGTVWIGCGDAPTSHGVFEPFSLKRLDHAPEQGRLQGGRDVSTTSRQAFEHFRRAYLHYLDAGDANLAGAEMDAARALAPNEPTYHALRGLFAIQMLDAETAERCFDRAIAIGHPDEERVAMFHLWRGRAHDLRGDRQAATTDYRGALARHADPQVHKAAKRDLKRTFDARQARKVHVDVALCDVVSP